MSYFNILFMRDTFLDLLSKVSKLDTLYQSFPQTLSYIKDTRGHKLLQDDNFYLKIFKYRYNDKTYVDPDIITIEFGVYADNYKDVLQELDLTGPGPKGLNKNLTNKQKLNLFSLTGDEEVVDYLIHINKFSTEDYEDALNEAAEGGHIDTVKLILKLSKDTISGRGYGDAGESASKRGYINIVKLMLKNGKGSIPKECYSFIINSAACEGHIDIVKLMLKKGKGIFSKHNYDWTLLMAAEAGHNDIVELLLNEVSNDYGEALKGAAIKDHKNTVKFILNKYKDKLSDDDYKWAIYVASEEGHNDIVELLLDEVSKYYGGALEAAAIRGNKSSVKFILNKYKDNLSTDDIEKAIQEAHDWDQADIVNLLKKEKRRKI